MKREKFHRFVFKNHSFQLYIVSYYALDDELGKKVETVLSMTYELDYALIRVNKSKIE